MSGVGHTHSLVAFFGLCGAIARLLTERLVV